MMTNSLFNANSTASSYRYHSDDKGNVVSEKRFDLTLNNNVFTVKTYMKSETRRDVTTGESSIYQIQPEWNYLQTHFGNILDHHSISDGKADHHLLMIDVTQQKNIPLVRSFLTDSNHNGITNKNDQAALTQRLGSIEQRVEAKAKAEAASSSAPSSESQSVHVATMKQ